MVTVLIRICKRAVTSEEGKPGWVIKWGSEKIAWGWVSLIDFIFYMIFFSLHSAQALGVPAFPSLTHLCHLLHRVG
jgi:hypothetical protein